MNKYLMNIQLHVHENTRTYIIYIYIFIHFPNVFFKYIIEKAKKIQDDSSELQTLLFPDLEFLEIGALRSN